MLAESRRSRSGFSMLEAVIALAVLAFGAALVVGRAGRAVEQVETHAAFQRVQTALDRLRQEAFATETRQTLTPEQARLPVGWTLRSEAALAVSVSGDCPPLTLELLKSGEVRARLVSGSAGCRLSRVR